MCTKSQFSFKTIIKEFCKNQIKRIRWLLLASNGVKPNYMEYIHIFLSILILKSQQISITWLGNTETDFSFFKFLKIVYLFIWMTFFWKLTWIFPIQNPIFRKSSSALEYDCWVKELLTLLMSCIVDFV